MCLFLNWILVLNVGFTIPSMRGSARILEKQGRMFFVDVPCQLCEGSLVTVVSSAAKIRSEVLSPIPFGSDVLLPCVHGKCALGGLIATTWLIVALSNPAKAGDFPEISKGLVIDIVAVSVFAFLFSLEKATKNAQLARLSSEENLYNLKLRIDEKRIISVSSLRGAARLVICAGPASFITEALKLSEPYTNDLLERGVLIVPFPTDGNTPSFKFDETEEMKDLTSRRRRLWQLLTPVYATEWSRWLEEQKKLAGVSLDSPVYLSLRMDGRMCGCGVGYPPWNAFVTQLPPVKGMWSGQLDGMDGRVL